MSVTERHPPATVDALREARMLIDGPRTVATSGAVLPVENPTQRRMIATIPRGDAEDVERAVQAASRAFPSWSRMVPRERGRLLLLIAELVEAEADAIGRVIALETGNALRTQGVRAVVDTAFAGTRT